MTNFKEDILQITTRLIVEEGFNYSEAKQKAGSMLKPNKRQKTKLNNFPTNLEIEKSVREYLQMFYSEESPAAGEPRQARDRESTAPIADWAECVVRVLCH